MLLPQNCTTASRRAATPSPRPTGTRSRPQPSSSSAGCSTSTPRRGSPRKRCCNTLGSPAASLEARTSVSTTRTAFACFRPSVNSVVMFRSSLPATALLLFCKSPLRSIRRRLPPPRRPRSSRAPTHPPRAYVHSHRGYSVAIL